jgi:predicted Zn-dependent protease
MRVGAPRAGSAKPFVAVLLACLLAGCASRAPVREIAPGSTPVSGTDEAELWYAMERAERELARSPFRVRDPALNDYVRKVACQVANDYCKDLRVYVMNVPQFNASMAPNGMMMVWTGALLRMRDEAELAAVLGHEVGHFTGQHSIRQWRRMKDMSSLLSAFQLLAYGAGVPDAAMLGALAGYAAIFKFSRDQEREADRLGFAALVGDGYDPAAAADIWARMLREENTRRYGRPTPIFSSHPETEERLADVTAAAAAIPDPPRERHREAYRAATRPFLESWLEGELARRAYDASVLVIRELLADAPAADRGVLTFYLGEAHRRRNQGNDRAEAARLYAQAVSLPGVPADAWREHGFAMQAAGDAAGARMALQRYLALAPQAEDRAFVQRELDKLGGAP